MFNFLKGFKFILNISFKKTTPFDPLNCLQWEFGQVSGKEIKHHSHLGILLGVWRQRERWNCFFSQCCFLNMNLYQVKFPKPSGEWSFWCSFWNHSGISLGNDNKAVDWFFRVNDNLHCCWDISFWSCCLRKSVCKSRELMVIFQKSLSAACILLSVPLSFLMEQVPLCLWLYVIVK